VDILDGTPLLDIKPYVPEFDRRPRFRLGWLGKAKGEVKKKKSDSRFRWNRHEESTVDITASSSYSPDG
jgi:tRNA (Thr-GGU) A37 N-methylase